MNNVLDEDLVSEKKYLAGRTLMQQLLQWLQKHIRIIAGLMLFGSSAFLVIRVVNVINNVFLIHSNPLLPSYLIKSLALCSVVEAMIMLSSFLLALFAFLKRKVKWGLLSIVVFLFYIFAVPYIYFYLEPYFRGI